MPQNNSKYFILVIKIVLFLAILHLIFMALNNRLLQNILKT